PTDTADQVARDKNEALLGDLTGQDCFHYLTAGSKHDEIGDRACRDLSSLVGDSKQPCGIKSRKPRCVFQFPSRKGHDVADSAIKCQDTSSKSALVDAAITQDLHLEGAEIVFSVGHARCADGVRDQHGAILALGAEEDADHARVHVDSVSDDIRRDAVAEHSTENARLAMIQGA